MERPATGDRRSGASSAERRTVPYERRNEERSVPVPRFAVYKARASRPDTPERSRCANRPHFFPPREEGTHTDTRGTIRARIDHRARARARTYNLSFHRAMFGSRSSTAVIKSASEVRRESGRYATVVNAAGLRP